MYVRLPPVLEPVEELEVRMRHEHGASRRLRLHLLVLLARGEVASRQAAATHLGVHRNTIGRWLEAYRRGGVDALLEVGRPGAKPQQRSLSAAVWAALEARLREGPGMEAEQEPPGEGVGFGSYREVQHWLAAKHGVDLPYPTVYKLVRHRLGAKLKRTRPCHTKRA